MRISFQSESAGREYGAMFQECMVTIIQVPDGATGGSVASIRFL